MRQLTLIILILFSCTTGDKKFDYSVSKVREFSGIVINNYRTTGKEELENFLRSVQEKEKLDSVNVFLTGDNINEINPVFKKYYFSKEENYKSLKWNLNDSLKLIQNIHIWVGTFKNDKFTPNESAYISDQQIFSR